jgi:hypothetical protein
MVSKQTEFGCDKCRGLTPPPGARCRACGRMSTEDPLHRCHVPGCTVVTKPEMLMCLAHVACLATYNGRCGRRIDRASAMTGT